MLANGQKVAECIYKELEKMLNDAVKANPEFLLSVCSGYRTYEKQESLLEKDIKDNMDIGMSYEEARNDALMTVAPPGYSEHQTGLAVDIISGNYQILDTSLELTAENIWLQKHCMEYGFILRYPKGKEELTGYSYEPWHFRYVGKEAAKIIYKRGLTLEEYIIGIQKSD